MTMCARFGSRQRLLCGVNFSPNLYEMHGACRIRPFVNSPFGVFKRNAAVREQNSKASRLYKACTLIRYMIVTSDQLATINAIEENK